MLPPLSPAAVNRRTLLLAICLAVAMGFAGWTWLRPYEWGRDDAARYRIVHASLERDHAYCWLGLYLKQAGAEAHDLQKPVLLVLADGREIEPAETQLEGDESHPTQALGFRFWLGEKDLAGPLRLKLNDGTLTVRKRPELPEGGEGVQYFLTANW